MNAQSAFVDCQAVAMASSARQSCSADKFDAVGEGYAPTADRPAAASARDGRLF